MTRITSKYGTFNPRTLQLGSVAPRLIVGVALISISLISAMAISKGGAEPVGVVVFAHDLDAGVRLTESDLSKAGVAAAEGTLEHLVLWEDRPSLVGMRLMRSAKEGEPVVRSSLENSGETLGRVVELPVSRAGSTPDLVPGESVDVVASFFPGTDVARTVVVASGVRIASIYSLGDRARAFGGSSDVGPSSLAADSSAGSFTTAEGGQTQLICALEVSGANLVELVFASQNAVLSLVRSIPGEELLGKQTSLGDPEDFKFSSR